MIEQNMGGTSSERCSLAGCRFDVRLPSVERDVWFQRSIGAQLRSRTTTFIDCALHFVRTLTRAFEAQALTDEMYGARICIADAPLSAESIANE